MRSAVVLPVDLPTALETFRQGHVLDARLGVPAHVTLLYPFVPATELRPSHRARLARAIARLAPFEYALQTIERWPDTLYVAPRPTAPFDALAARLAAEWPAWPLYGGGAVFEAHVTLGEPVTDAEETGLRSLAADCLPAARRATEAILITEDRDGRWATRWRLPLRSAR